MTKDKALRRALEALDKMYSSAHDIAEPAITAIREALAHPQQEPVAWWHQKSNTFTSGSLVSNFVEWTPLYTSPPARKPLTDEEIYECERIAAIRHQKHKHSIRGQQVTAADDPQWHFARAIEAAHGIKGDA